MMTPSDPASPAPVFEDGTHDAVVVVPGIMGSELVERETGKTLWSMGTLLGYGVRWGHREGLAALAVTDQERAGQTTRVVATSLLHGPAWAPVLGGVEPYGKLTTALRVVVAHPSAILEFAYDWRLSVDYNARLLAEAAHRHLETWRAHPAHAAARWRHPEGREARLVFVAHSMGGLLVRALSALSGVAEAVRATITMGTPFHGSVKAVELLAHGRGSPVPLPAASLRKLAATMPGLHDLLPSYRCVLTDDDVVALKPTDIGALGGNAELASEALSSRQKLSDTQLREHVLIAGTAQPTTQTLRLRDGAVHSQPFGYFRLPDGELARDEIGRPIPIDHGGDGTVYRYAAALQGVTQTGIAQQHAALPKCTSVLDVVRGALTGIDNLGTVLGAGRLGLDVPDFIHNGELRIVVTGCTDPALVSCVVEDVADFDTVVAAPQPPRRSSDMLIIDTTVPKPGLYRVCVSAGEDPVSRLVLAGAADANDS